MKDNKNKPPQRNRRLTFEDDDFLFNDDPIKKESKILGIKSEYMVFYVAIAIVGVIVVFVGALGAFNAITRGAPPPPPPPGSLLVNQNGGEDSNIVITAPENVLSFTGVITGIDESNRIFQIHNVSSRENHNLFVQPGSELRGRFGQLLVFNEFDLGTIVEVSYDPDNSHVVALGFYNGSEAFEYRFVSGLQIDPAGGIILFEGRLYIFNSDLVVLNNGLPYDIENIQLLTLVTMRGIGNTVWYIEIERGFGTVQIVNNTAIINGFAEIGREESVPLGAGVNPLEHIVHIGEGAHSVIIHGSNIDLTTMEITVTSGQTTTLDLTDIEITSGYLNININIESAIATIGGLQINPANPVSLPFGPHRIVVNAQGYQSFDEVIEFEEHNQNLNVVLIPEQETTPPPGGIDVNQPTSRVEIRTEPTGASVFIDGTFVGTSPVITQAINGQREVTLQLEGFTSTVAPIFVSPQTLPFTFEMQPLPTSPQPGLPTPPQPTQPPVMPPTPPPTVVEPPTPPAQPVDPGDISFVPAPGQR